MSSLVLYERPRPVVRNVAISAAICAVLAAACSSTPAPAGSEAPAGNGDDREAGTDNAVGSSAFDAGGAALRDAGKAPSSLDARAAVLTDASADARTPVAGDGSVPPSQQVQTDASAAPDAAVQGPATPGACSTPQPPVGDQTFTLKSANGVTYKYILSISANVPRDQKAPLMIHWHALGSSPEEARMLTHVDTLAQSTNLIMVYPISPDNSWDVDSCCTNTMLFATRRDEEVFARELVKEVQSKACVDERRIYTSGFSNGGMMSQMLACKAADVFAASFPMGSTLTIPESDCKPSRPIPIMMINGTEDPLVGYDAPGLAGGLSVPADYKLWQTKNGCTGEPETTVMKGAATCTTYKNCKAGAETAACVVKGMGHCVPGMKAESATNCLTKDGITLGAPNNDIDGIDLMEKFLLRFSLP